MTYTVEVQRTKDGGVNWGRTGGPAPAAPGVPRIVAKAVAAVLTGDDWRVVVRADDGSELAAVYATRHLELVVTRY